MGVMASLMSMTESAQQIDESLDIPKREYQITLIYILRYIFFYLLFIQTLTASSPIPLMTSPDLPSKFKHFFFLTHEST